MDGTPHPLSYFGARKDLPSLWGVTFFKQQRALFPFAPPLWYFVRYSWPWVDRCTMKVSCPWTKYKNSSQLHMLTWWFLLAGKRWWHRRRSCSTRWWQGLMLVIFGLNRKMKILALVYSTKFRATLNVWKYKAAVNTFAIIFFLSSGHHIVYFAKK